MEEWTWERDNFDSFGKLKLLYRQQRFFDEGGIGHRVLDIGGWRKMCFRLGQEGREPVLLNLRKKSLLKARNMKRRHKSNQFELICADAHHLPFQAETFDTVYSAETLEHVKSAELVCNDILYILKPEGIFCGTVPIPGICHHQGEDEIRFFSSKQLRILLSKFQEILKIEETPSIKPDGSPCSIMFVAKKS